MDLALNQPSSPQDGIFYQFNAAQTAITYEYYLERVGDASYKYHFTVAYDSSIPGIFTYTYYSAGGSTDNGVYAAVGMQGGESFLVTHSRALAISADTDHDSQ